MTLIRTESGKMVEARDGDLCRAFHKAFCGRIGILPVEIVLLHRPFAVGDAIEQVCGDGLSCWEYGGKVGSTLSAEHLNKLPPEFWYRHADPALRDHSQFLEAGK